MLNQDYAYLTVREIIEQIERSYKENAVVHYDDGCGHPVFFTGKYSTKDGNIIIEYISDEDVQKEDFITLKDFLNILKQLPDDFKCCIQETGVLHPNEYFPIYFWGISDCIDSGEICYREEEGEDLITDCDFACFMFNG